MDGSRVRYPLALVVPLFLLLASPAPHLAAQEGVLSGSVRAADTNAPLESVAVEVLDADGAREARALTGQNGRFRITGVPAGTYRVTFSLPGWQPVERTGVAVRAGEVTELSVMLAAGAYTLNPLTVSAARQEERLLDAPASVAVIDRQEVESQPAGSYIDLVEGKAGMDVIRTGLQQGYVVARGFNNVFSGSLLALTDHRIARVPSLRVNIPHLDPSTTLDLERVELVLGPGSALYGPNAANGVLHQITKSPIDDPGSVVSLGGGLRQQDAVPGFGASDEGVFHGQARVAHRFSDQFGLKLSGEWFTGKDYQFRDPAEEDFRGRADDCLADYSLANPECVELAPAAGQLPDQGRLERIAQRDFDLERWTLDASAEWRPDAQSEVTLSYGRSQSVNSIDLTGIGAAQSQDFAYQYAQARFNRDDLFAQAFVNWSDAGDTYILRTGQPIDDESFIVVGQLQHAFDLGESQRFVYGVDYIHTNPVTNRSINGVHEDDDRINEVGGYVQSETQLSDRWELTLAGRADYHSVLDEVIFSPRGAVVFKPEEEHSLRLTFNRAFATPDNNNLFLDILAQRIPLGGPSYGINAQGTTDRGFTFQRDAGGRPMMKSPFLPDPNTFIPTRTASPAPGVPGLWDLAVAVVSAQDPSTGMILASLPAPTEDQVGVDLRLLNTGTGAFESFSAGFDGLDRIPAIQEEITNTLEVGYKGLVAQRLLLSVDAYWTRVEDFIGPLAIETPNAFLDTQDLEAYLTPFVGPAAAQQLAVSIGGLEGDPDNTGIPLGVVTPREVAADGANLLLTYRNVGDVDFFGGDLSATYQITDQWETSLAMSVVEDNVFSTDEGEPVELNAPDFKAGASLAYRNQEPGFHGELAYRFVNGFPAASGVFVGQVEDYNTVDLTLGYRIPGLRGTTIQLDVQNLFDNEYRTFPGAPELGRFTLARVRYEF